MAYNTFVFAWQYVGRNVLTMIHVLFFTLLCLFLFALGYADTAVLTPPVQAMIVLVALFFTGQRLLEDFHTRCRQDHVLPGILLTGCRPATLFMGITLAMAGWLFLLCVALLLALHLLFPALAWTSYWILAATLLIGVTVYAAIGILCYGFMAFGAVAAPMVFTLYFPLLIPLFLLMHRNLMSALTPSLSHSLGPLLGMGLIFVFLSALLYEWISENAV